MVEEYLINCSSFGRRWKSRMNSVAGIFLSRATAVNALDRLNAIGLDRDRVILLSPGTPDEDLEEHVATTEAEETGPGERIGSSIGRGAGIAGGIMFGGAVGSIFVPGVGPVLAAGVLAAALLGTAGAALGGAAGREVDDELKQSVRHEELHLYEAALRQGRSVVIAVPLDAQQGQAARDALNKAGAESLDDARETWWRDLRRAEAEAYSREGKGLAFDEDVFRSGFEAALHPRARGFSFFQSASFLREYFSKDYQTDSFRRGYERGQEYQLKFLEEFPPAGY